MSRADTNRQMGAGLGAHHRACNGASDDWLTPPEIIEALGPFDLDPCAASDPPWPTAREMWDQLGLMRPWHGLVWCNPPYGPQTGRWLDRCAAHQDALALIFARTETRWFFRTVWNSADAILFLRGRLTFHRPDGSPAERNAGGPSAIVAYGKRAVGRLGSSGLSGRLVTL